MNNVKSDREWPDYDFLIYFIMIVSINQNLLRWKMYKLEL